ncbi:hypothetical protein H4W80_003625 [Nonomuraea angiospora]|uniref:Uncharacterized protein n=1 Tax=Nonomuraea angiospora TaxID=46172 RepID=A0ABR9LXK2_9ACTN|nr:hypothetical protein [Nonomuraea angiospora]
MTVSAEATAEPMVTARLSHAVAEAGGPEACLRPGRGDDPAHVVGP